jgi:hypothetical protein
MDRIETEDLTRWLGQFESLPVECDGMTRLISTLLQREEVEHEICIGQLEVAGVGATPLHWWISFPDGRICDLRARMWLRNSPDAPHGVFTPTKHQTYLENARLPAYTARLDPVVFMILAEKSMDEFPLISAPAPKQRDPGL